MAKSIYGFETLRFVVGIAAKLTLTATALTLAEAVNIVAGTSTGTKIGTASSQKLGFWGATPVVRQEVTGARDETEGALANLLAALATAGIITDSTTAS